MGGIMRELPLYISKKHLTFWWRYCNTNGEPLAINIRYDEPGKKKRFHQHHINSSGNWVEGAPTPLPLFGINTLPKSNYDGFISIFEGEKCAQAAHYLNLPAITSMGGSSQGHLADWPVVAGFRHLKKFVIFPDNDDPGKKYAQVVITEIKRACPHAEILVCHLPNQKKGDDFVDWLQTHEYMKVDWNGFAPIEELCAKQLHIAINNYVRDHCVAAETFQNESQSCPVQFEFDPEPIHEVLSPVLPCPVDSLPCSIKIWMNEIADQMQIPIDYLAAPFVVFAGSVIGRKRALLMRSGTEWIEYPNLWGMIIGRPSLMKSPAMSAMQAPLHALAESSLKNFEKDIKAYRKKMELWKIHKKAADEVYKKEIKEALENNTSVNDRDLPVLEEEPKEPVRKRHKTDDPTVEKLGELLIDNPHGLLLFRDELKGWLLSFEKIGRENDRQFYLESWSGKKDFDVDRIGRGSLHIPALMLSIFGSIQPGPLSQYVRTAVKGGNGDDGFLQRFQLMVWPDISPEFNIINTPLNKENVERVKMTFELLDQLPYSQNGESVILKFDEEGQALFDSWQHQLENHLRKASLPVHLEAHFAKYKKLVASLCIIFEHLKMASQEKAPFIIQVETLKNVLQWVKYFESHAYRIYGSSVNAVPKTALQLLTHIKKGDLAIPFSVRDVYHGHHWSGLTNSAEVEEVLEYLCEKGYLASANLQANGHPTRKYWAHPKIFEKC